MRRVLEAITGICVLVGVATALGIASNALRSDGLPIIRKPLSETRAMVRKEQLMASVPIRVPQPKRATHKVNKSPAAPADQMAVTPKTTEQTTGQLSLKKPQPLVVRDVAPAPQTVQSAEESNPKANKPAPAPKKIQALFTNLKDAKACFDSKSAIFMDARLAEDYEAEHITGALWLCYESVEEDYDKVLGQIPKDRLLITYCSDQQCASAIKLADAMVARGHTLVVIMLEGLPGWKDAGYPTTTGKEAGG